MALSRETKVNKAESFDKKDWCSLILEKICIHAVHRGCPVWDPVCSRQQFFIAANNRLQQNQSLCFLAVKAGPEYIQTDTYATYSQFYSWTAETVVVKAC